MEGIGDLGECVQAAIARRFASNDCSALAPLGACSQANEKQLRLGIVFFLFTCSTNLL